MASLVPQDSNSIFIQDFVFVFFSDVIKKVDNNINEYVQLYSNKRLFVVFFLYINNNNNDSN